MSLRINRVSEQILHEISGILRRNFREDAEKITIVGAIVTPDLRFARVRFSVFGGETEERKALRFFSKQRLTIKKMLCDQLRMRSAVDLSFQLTHAMEEGSRVIELLDSMKDEKI